MERLKRVFSKKNRALLVELVRTDFKLRYQDSVLGYLWSLLKPLFLFGILFVVFDVILKISKGIPYYPVYLLLGVMLWNFFGEATRQGMSSIVSRGDLLRKVKLPKYIVVFSATISALINLILNLIIVIIFIIIIGSEVKPLAVVLIPVLFVELYLFSLAISFYLSAVNVKYRDVSHIWDVVLQAGFYATPIIYPLQVVADYHPGVAKILLLNPVAQVIQDARYLLTTDQSLTMGHVFGSGMYYLVPIIIVISSLIIFGRFFKKKSKYFTEDL